MRLLGESGKKMIRGCGPQAYGFTIFPGQVAEGHSWEDHGWEGVKEPREGIFRKERSAGPSVVSGGSWSKAREPSAMKYQVLLQEPNIQHSRTIQVRSGWCHSAD